MKLVKKIIGTLMAVAFVGGVATASNASANEEVKKNGALKKIDCFATINAEMKPIARDTDPPQGLD